ncbi:cobalamine operon protein, hydrolase [Haloferax mucosum ATCC BAA-1512]|uniref:Cobalamine operon protein, hydrolase n=1 Tax=Haloferax mucosum ATCC BAA-1512 TaxID=662479 RepID=M0I5B1_9EURY|nr:HAD family hydrolase [Haloferax mucosum]ELZ91951.1 cobalamine operon protein, hydrolase [Haloferax mucosum ATCC BAA-1512]
MAVTFDLFGTLVDVEYPTDPGTSVADALCEYGVDVPSDWDDAYREVHIDAPEGAEVPLPAHVAAALRSRGAESPDNAARRAVITAFDPDVTTRPGAVEAVEAAREAGPVGLLSNCSVPELVARTLIRSDLDRRGFDSITTSVACGWRKPHRQAFEAAARGLDVNVSDLVHVGDDPDTDGGIEAVGGQFVSLETTALDALATRLRAGEVPCP